MSAILETKNLSIHFGGLKAVDDVTFQAEEGEITAIIGPNGAGKTTVFNLLAGFYEPTEGSVFFDGQDMKGIPTYKRTSLGMARTFQNINLFKSMSVMDNALVGLHTRMKADPISCILHTPKMMKEQNKAKEEMMEILDLLGLADVADVPAGSLSYGKQKNLEIARAVATHPKLLLLDEPASGLNTQELDELSLRVEKLRQRGISIILIEHKMDVVMSISHKIMVLNFGKNIAYGTPEEIKNNPLVIEAYLGKDDEEE